MPRLSLLVILIAVTIDIVGCDTSYKYIRPTASAEQVATITGSRIRNSDSLRPDARVYLVAIDGKLTEDGPFGWDHKTPVTPGPHQIEFGVSQKSLVQDAWGFGSIQVTLEAGRTYTLTADDPTRVTPNCAMTMGWLVGDAAQAISERVPVMVADFTGAEIPVGGGGFVSVPSHTRCPAK